MTFALIIAASLVLALLYSALYAGLRALTDGALHAIAEAEGPSAREAQRALDSYASIRARLRLGRVVFLAVAAGCAVVLAPDATMAVVAASLVGLTYSLLAEASTAVARRRANRGALRMLRWCRPLELLMAPFAAPITAAANAIEASVPLAEPPTEVAAQKIEHVIDEGAKEGAIETAHAELLRNALEFRDTVAREVMVPRTRVVGFEVGTPFDAVMEAVEEHAHSRYPVYRGSMDHMEGVLYVKDLFRVVREGREAPALSELMRSPVFFAAETQPIGSLLREMQKSRFHLAVVADEFGGVSGIVTLEDILEELVGEIEDEHDDDDRLVSQDGPDSYIADATVSVYDLQEMLGETLVDPEGEFDSLGGMVVQLAGEVPAVGAHVGAGGYDVEVLEADERAVLRVRLTRQHERAAS
ncbi:MAG: hemolysin family protein [Myxococcota bacterium]